MQFADQIRPETLAPGIVLIFFEELYEGLVGLLIDGVGGAPVPLHAIFFKPEMLRDVALKKINQMNQKIAGLFGRIGLGQQALQMIDVLNQNQVLPVNRVRTGFEVFVPFYHGGNDQCG